KLKLSLGLPCRDALRSEYRPRRPCALLKYPRPKTKPEYQAIYPWLLPDETDPHFVFCAVCECRLSCKRSDLGKHEGSIKHSENAQRKAQQPLVKWECSGEEECQLSQHEGEGQEEEEDDEEEGEEEASQELDSEDPDCEEENEGEPEEADPSRLQNDLEAEPASKQQRRISETDSQNSGLLDYLPLQVTINELPVLPGSCGFSTPPAQPAAQPCRITIKKVPVPVQGTPPNPGIGPPEISSKATITPITGACYTPTARATPSYAARQLQSYQLQAISPLERAPRDSLELFFDSICATVKGLPPKLATEGKIRVMQLIGELELRALSEQEEHSIQGQSEVLTASQAGEYPGSGQQHATVASTTK
ncbi:hypothetical protein KR018_005922, partial [Drosophila ironensis]